MSTPGRKAQEITAKNTQNQQQNQYKSDSKQDDQYFRNQRNVRQYQIQGQASKAELQNHDDYSMFNDDDRMRSILDNKFNQEEERSRVDYQYEVDYNDLLSQQVSSSRLFDPTKMDDDSPQKRAANEQTLYGFSTVYAEPLTDIPMPEGVQKFLTEPAPKGGMIQCTLKCDKSWKGLLYPKYHLFLSHNGKNYLMSAEIKSFYSSTYLIYADQHHAKDDYFAYIKINSSKKEYSLFNKGKEDVKSHSSESQLIHGLVIFDQNNPKETGPRQIKALLHVSNKTVNYRIVNCVNTQPAWSNKHKAYYMNFFERVNQASEYNFQLVEEHDQNKILLQFGQFDDDYNLDFQWPISPLQAFQIAISRLNYS